MPLVLLELSDGRVGIMLAGESADVGRETAVWETTGGGRTVTDWSFIVPADLPASKRWRDAWRHSAGAVVVDAPAARGMRAGELEAERDKLIDALTRRAAAAEDADDAAGASAARAARRGLRGLTAQALAGRLAPVAVAGLDGFDPAELAAARRLDADLKQAELTRPAGSDAFRAVAATFRDVGAVRQEVPAAAKEVVSARYVLRGSDGRAAGGSVVVRPGEGADLYSVGGEVVRLDVDRGGAVGVRRTGGVLLWSVGLDLMVL